MSDRTTWQRIKDEKSVVLEVLSHLRFRRQLHALPQGDGHTVMVVPAFSVSDRATRPLRSALDAIGYEAVGWNQGSNRGVTPEAVAELVQRTQRLAQAAGPVSIVGWSLGGLFGRIVARDVPTEVRSVVTLGSPFRRVEEERGLAPPAVPTTSIFSKTDAVVDWRNASEPDGPDRRSIEVRGTHSGLALNPEVVRVVADALAAT